MKFHKLIPLAVVILVLFVSSCSKENDPQAIMESFSNYKSAILNQNGELAYSFIDSNTKNYYDDIFDKVLNLSETETKKLSLLNRIAVTMGRHNIENDVLSAMNGKLYFIYAVENGWIGEESVSTLEITVSEVDKNFAKTHVVDENGEAPFGFSFRRENKKWCIDLTSMFPITDKILSQQIEKIGVSENAFIFAMLRTIAGYDPDPTVWQPVN